MLILSQQPTSPLLKFMMENAVELVIGFILSALFGYITYQFRRFPFFLSWCHTLVRGWAVIWCRRRYRHMRLVYLEDYVYILEQFRERLVRFCDAQKKKDDRPTIHIFVCTRQLPGDWPLDNIEPHLDKTPLEEYAWNFQQFCRGSRERNYDVDIKRAIIMDNAGTEKGKERSNKLRDSLSKDVFRNYIKYLHESDKDCLVLNHARPWPSWLSDTVFYGITAKTIEKTWLWAITSTYDPAEDLVVVQQHRKLKRKLPKSCLPLPGSTPNLYELVSRLSSCTFGAQPVEEWLRDKKDSDGAEN